MKKPLRNIKLVKDEKFHSLDLEEIYSKFSSDSKGLSAEEAKKRLEIHGLNEIPEKRKKSMLSLFFDQFKSALIFILFIAAFISYLSGHMIDVYVILGIVLVNAIMGFVQEVKAEESIRALKKMTIPIAKVFRNNDLIQVNANELVPGDIILIEEGDRIAADARLIEVKNFKTLEASLTGESMPAEKDLKTLDKNTSIGDRKNMVWMGTFAASGAAKAVIVNTGTFTVLGSIARDIEDIKLQKDHFRVKTDILAKQMAMIAILGAALTFIIGYFYDHIDFTEMLLFSISSLVSGIPEGLPAVLVIVLSIGANRMAKKKAIIRKLSSTETLGVIDTIVTDKTGTLTTNTMMIKKILIPGEKDYDVTGKGWIPKGDFFQEKKQINPFDSPTLFKLIHVAGICNSANIIKKEDSYECIGDPTEGALVALAQKAGISKDDLKKSEEVFDDLPFSSDNKYRATLVKHEKKYYKYYVGAPEKLLKLSTKHLSDKGNKNLDESARKEIIQRIDKLTGNAMRVLALAYKPLLKKPDSISDVENEKLVFLGVVGMVDPLRPEVIEAVSKAKLAGINIIMSTGDHKNTAMAIALESGIINEEEFKDPEIAITEEEINDLSKEDFKKVVSKAKVYARLSPNMKLRIAQELQVQGHLIAMTGDGVNDAPALKKADIGIAMGIMGTEVSKEVSDMVLTDDNFATIINAIEEGRIVYDNTKKASYYLITTNFAEDFAIIVSLLLKLPLLLLPTQILWLNLVTDGISDIALATEPGHGEVMDEKPKSKKEQILSRNIIPYLLTISILMGAMTITFFYSYLPQGLDKARTIAFSVMTFSQLWRLLNMRSFKKSIFEIGFFTNKYVNWALAGSTFLYLIAIFNPFFQTAFSFVALGAIEIIEIVILTSSVLWIGELFQFIKNKGKKKMMS
ncbi:MAG: HAD-IC family P-type ATPase [Candidatus Nanoarchaeia archaeon]|nr:HAD-IC family P-type ATPase [Candidatus Nanoarchaeia archaeon]